MANRDSIASAIAALQQHMTGKPINPGRNSRAELNAAAAAEQAAGIPVEVSTTVWNAAAAAVFVRRTAALANHDDCSVRIRPNRDIEVNFTMNTATVTMNGIGRG